MASSRKPVEADLPARLHQVLSRLLPASADLCLGLSGGLDSIVLLHLLACLREASDYVLAAVHVHHGLSPQADAWQALCQAACDRLGVPLEVARVRVEPAGQGLEAAARAARYAVYAHQQARYIVLAHQQDDQAETLLLNLLRGSGVVGLAAMPEMRPLQGGQWLLRPLLGIPRRSLAAYAAVHGLAWVEDESNQDTAYVRNHLRLAVLPVVEQRFPAFREVLGRAARHFAECDQLLDDLARLDARHTLSGDALGLDALRRLDLARQKNLLRWYLAEHGLSPLSAARLEDLIEQLARVGHDTRFHFPVDGRDLRVWRGRLLIVPAAAVGGVQETSWRGESCLVYGGGQVVFTASVGQGVSLARLTGLRLTLGPRRGGETLRPDCHRPRRVLKKLYQESGVPSWQRAALPLLYADDVLVWAAELGVDCAFRAAPGEPSLVISWHPPWQ